MREEHQLQPEDASEGTDVFNDEGSCEGFVVRTFLEVPASQRVEVAPALELAVQVYSPSHSGMALDLPSSLPSFSSSFVPSLKGVANIAPLRSLVGFEQVAHNPDSGIS